MTQLTRKTKRMIVDPSLPTHPKFLALRAEVGDRAMEYLINIWGHCQTAKRGGNWGRVTAEYLELVANFPKNPKSSGKLWKALTRSVNPDGRGFVEVDGGGNVIIHGWDEQNKSLITNWLNGKKGGRPRVNGAYPARNPTETHGLTQPEPERNQGLTKCEPIRVDRSREDKSTPLPLSDSGSEPEEKTAAGGVAAEEAEWQPEAVIPTVDEMVTRLANAGVTRELCERYHAWRTGYEQWLIRTPRGWVLRDWPREVPEWKARDEAQRSGGRAGASVSGERLTAELEAIQAELQWQTEEPRRAALKKRREEINRGRE